MNVDQYKRPRSLVKMKHFFRAGKTNFLKRIKFNWFSASERDTQREEKCITYFACAWNIFAFFVVEIRASANFLFEKKGRTRAEVKKLRGFSLWIPITASLLFVPLAEWMSLHFGVILAPFYCRAYQRFEFTSMLFWSGFIVVARLVVCTLFFFRPIFSPRTHSHFGFTIFSVLCPHVSFFLSQHSCWVRLCV